MNIVIDLNAFKLCAHAYDLGIERAALVSAEKGEAFRVTFTTLEEHYAGNDILLNPHADRKILDVLLPLKENHENL